MKPNPNSGLIQIIKANELDSNSANLIQQGFAPFFEALKPLTQAAESLTVDSVDQTEQMAEARRLRLQLKAIRVESEKTRKALKSESLRTGKAIDGAHNIIKYLTEGKEAKLLEMEQYIQKAKQAEQEKTKIERLAMLAPYEGHYVSALDFGTMSESDYQITFNTAKASFDAAVAAAAEAERLEAERLEKIEAERKAKAEADKKARIEAEKRLKQEQAERKKAEAKAKIKFEAEQKAAKIAQQKAEAERKEKEKIAKELAEIKAAETKAAEDAEKARQAKLKASEADKLDQLIQDLKEIELPIMKSKRYKAMVEKARLQLAELAGWLAEKK